MDLVGKAFYKVYITVTVEREWTSCSSGVPQCYQWLFSLSLTTRNTWQFLWALSSKSIQNTKKKNLITFTSPYMPPAFTVIPLNFCNIFPAGLPAFTLVPTSILCHSQISTQSPESFCKTDYVTPLLKTLHWFPISLRIEVKVIQMRYEAPCHMHTPLSLPYLYHSLICSFYFDHTGLFAVP